MMNDYAEQIGLTGSNFVNPTGLPAEGHLMTPRDLAKLSKLIIETYPEFYPYFAQKEFRYRDKFTFRNRNPLVWSEVGVDGLKTGYTKEAGYGLVSSAKRGDQPAVDAGRGEQTPVQVCAHGSISFCRSANEAARASTPTRALQVADCAL